MTILTVALIDVPTAIYDNFFLLAKALDNNIVLQAYAI